MYLTIILITGQGMNLTRVICLWAHSQIFPELGMKKIIVLFWTLQVGSKEANCWLRILANLSWGCLAWKAAEVITFWLCSVDLPVTRTKLFFNLIRCFKKAEYKLQISFSSRRKVLPFTEVSWNDQRQRCLYIEF